MEIWVHQHSKGGVMEVEKHDDWYALCYDRFRAVVELVDGFRQIQMQR